MIAFELLEAHRKQVPSGALQALLRSRHNNAIEAHLLKPSDMIWPWYKPSKQNEKNEWTATVAINARQHYIEAEGSPNGRTMRISYEDFRMRL